MELVPVSVDMFLWLLDGALLDMAKGNDHVELTATMDLVVSLN